MKKYPKICIILTLLLFFIPFFSMGTTSSKENIPNYSEEIRQEGVFYRNNIRLIVLEILLRKNISPEKVQIYMFNPPSIKDSNKIWSDWLNNIDISLGEFFDTYTSSYLCYATNNILTKQSIIASLNEYLDFYLPRIDI